MKKLLFLVLLILHSSLSLAQVASDFNGYFDSLLVSQDGSIDVVLLWALDTRATDGYDGDSGIFEADGPPPPPDGLWARFVIDDHGTGLIPDVRNYDSFPFTSETTLKLELIGLQAGSDPKLFIDYPEGIEVHLVDPFGGALVDVTLSGKDSLTLNPAITSYSFTLKFNNFDPANIVGVEDEKIPSNLELYQNYPNPFNPNTTINFSLNKRSDVSIKIYDVIGNEISQLADKVFSAGNHSINFSASNLSSGVYIYQLKTNGTVISKKMTLLK